MQIPIAIATQQVATVSPYVVDGSTIVQVACDRVSGTAFYLGNAVYMTARHVIRNVGCKVRGQPIRVLSEGKGPHDWAMFTAPFYAPFRVSYSCSHMRAGDPYLSTGYALANGWQVTLRLTASDQLDADDGSREMRGVITPGMSGGPVADRDGVVYAINAWQMDVFGVEVPTSGVVELADTDLCRKESK